MSEKLKKTKKTEKTKKTKIEESYCQNLSDLYNTCVQSTNNKKGCTKLIGTWYDINCNGNKGQQPIFYPET